MSQVFVLFLTGFIENLECFVLKLFFWVMGFFLLLGVLNQLLSTRREKLREKDEIFFLFCYCCRCCGWELVCGRQNETSVEDWWKKGWKKLTHKKEVAGRQELQEEEEEAAAKLGQLFWMRMPYLETRNCELLWEVGWDFRL
jgi:hypothetical protein